MPTPKLSPITKLKSHTKYYIQNTKYKLPFLIACLLLIILLPILYLSLRNPEQASAWFNDNWAYRQPFTFTHNAAISAERAITFSLDTAELITAGNLQSDCDDIRFTTPDGQLLKHQLTGSCNNAASTYEVVFPNIINGTNLGYVYYGNTSATSTSQDVSGITALTPNGGDPAITDRTSEQKAPAPVTYLTFDEGTGSTANDSTQQNNDGTISGAAWKTEDMCLSGKCLYYDGSDDVTTITNATTIDFDTGLSAGVTFAAWVKVTTDGESSIGQIFYKGATTYLRTTNDGSNAADLEASLDLGTTDATATVTDGLTLNRWHHVAFGYTDDGDDEITVYIDGIQRSASTNGVGSPATSDTANLLIGGTTTANFHGFIDEFKVYQSERTPAQIKLDAQGTSTSGVSAQFGSSNATSLSEGLVGYWPMDESSGNRADSSGNNFTLTDVNTVTSATGKFGNAASFAAASSETFSLADNTAISIGTTNFTMSAWIYIATTGADRMIFRKGVAGGNDREYSLYYKNSVGKIAFTVSSNGSPGPEITSDAFGTVTTSTWYFVTAYHDVTTGQIGLSINGGTATTTAHTGGINDTSNTFYIGSENAGGNYWDGRIDEVRLYRRLLSPAEIRTLYNWAPGPLTYYNFDENTGQTVNDLTGNGNSAFVGTSGSIEGTDPTWVPGKFGSGLSFDGTNDIVEKTGYGSVISSLGQATFEYWFKAPTTNDGVAFAVWINNGGADAQRIVGARHFSDESIRVNITNADDDTGQYVDSSAGVLPIDQWSHVAIAYDGSLSAANRLKIFLNGVPISLSITGTIPTTLNSATGDLDFGDYASAGCCTGVRFTGTIDEFKVYDYTRTPAQIIEDMNGGHPVGGSPVASQVAYWAFDEGYGTTANDQTINENSLTLSTASWTNSGKFNKAWDGTGALWLSRADDPDFDFLAAEDFSISGWFKHNTASATEVILNKEESTGADGGYRIQMESDGDITFGIDDDNTSFPEDSVTSTLATYDDDSWHHFAAVKTGTTSMRLYIDAQEVGTADTSISSTGTLANDDTLYVGDSNGSNGSDEFNGDLDELKIYRAALTIDQIRTEYNQGQSASFGSSGTTSAGIADNSAARTYCIPGDSTSCNPPVLHLPLDENTGTSSVFDISGNGSTGTMNGSMTTSSWVPGKYGSALNFDGSDDQISLGDLTIIDNSDFTYEAWINLDSYAADECSIISKWSAESNRHRFFVTTSGALSMLVNQGGGPVEDATANSLINTGTWQHVAMVVDITTGDVQAFYIDGQSKSLSTNQDLPPISPGSDSFTIARRQDNNDECDGRIDEVKIYNYERTPAQIAWEYNRGVPIAHYELDECQGPTIYNSAVNGNGSAAGLNGTLTIGGSGSTTAVGTCTTSGAWFNGVSGKYGSSMDLDGTDDYISVADASAIDFENTNPFSISAWIKTTDSDYASIVGKLNTAANYRGYRLVIQNSGILRWQIISTWSSDVAGIDTTQTVNDGAWHHVIATYDGSVSASGMKIYINGQQAATSASHTSLSATILNDVALNIGAGGGTSVYEPFDGQIDDVRIYNYALTAAQVKNIMNTGAVSFQ